MANTVIEAITIDDMLTHCKDMYNSNNHWSNDIMSGSALFHLIIYEDKLYGKNSDVIYFRYTC